MIHVTGALIRRARRGARRRVAVPLAGVAIVAASLVALDRAGLVELRSRLGAGLALLVVGPFLAPLVLWRPRAAWLLATAAAVPGAVVVADVAAAESDLGWVRALVFTATVAGGALVAAFDHGQRRAALGPTLLAGTVLGMYATLPDTEQITVVVGAALPLAFLGWPFVLGVLGPGAYATVGLLAWVATVGGHGRPGSIVGALAGLGLLLVEPVVRPWWRGRAASPPRPVHSVGLIALQAGVVTVTSRIAGLETAAGTAAAISGLVLLAAGCTLAVLRALAPRARAIQPPGS